MFLNKKKTLRTKMQGKKSNPPVLLCLCNFDENSLLLQSFGFDTKKTYDGIRCICGPIAQSVIKV